MILRSTWCSPQEADDKDCLRGSPPVWNVNGNDVGREFHHGRLGLIDFEVLKVVPNVDLGPSKITGAANADEVRSGRVVGRWVDESTGKYLSVARGSRQNSSLERTGIQNRKVLHHQSLFGSGWVG